MTQEEKELVIKDLCGRLPYGVKANVSEWDKEKQEEVNISRRVHSIDIDGYLVFESNGYGLNYYWIENCALLLRPLSSMSADEVLEYISLKESIIACDDTTYFFETYKSIDWLNKNMFDYRGLITRGLANEAPEGMYLT